MFLNQLEETVLKVRTDIAAGPIVPDVRPEEIRSYLESSYGFNKTLDLAEVVADVEKMLSTWQVQVTHPRYLGLFNPSVTTASVVADTLVAMYNPQLATWRTSPAANEIERHTLKWLMEKFGLPSNAAASFTSGGAESNLTAVIAALTKRFPAYGDHGLRSLPMTPTFYVSAEAHHSFNKIAHMTGLGRQALRMVATDADLKMNIEDLKLQIMGDREAGRTPFMVVGTAGTTAGGVIDPLPGLANFCSQHNLWFHVDAAWGGAAVISPKLKHCLKGIEAADSITCDAHKWFSVSMGAGMFFCRHPDTIAEAFRVETVYMPKTMAGVSSDPYTSTVQWSRRFIGLKLFLTLAEKGELGYIEMIEHQAHMGEVLRELLRQAGWKVVNKTPLPLVCFTREGLDITRFLSALHKKQIAWMAEVRLADGSPVIRACITSFMTTKSDLEEVVREMNLLAESGELEPTRMNR